jgi:hypothetical protein
LLVDVSMTANEFRDYVREVPLLGGLVDCDASDHWEALGQTFVVVLFSTAPIWLATLIVYGSGSRLAYADLRAAVHGSVANGELFMYCTALLAPIFWVALVDLPGVRAFPSKISHMVLMAVIDLAAAVFFGLSSAGKHLNDLFTFRASTSMFIFSVALLYLGTVYHVSRVAEATTEFKRQETDFTDEMREHRQ